MALPDLLNALRARAAEGRALELEEARDEAARIRADAGLRLERRRTDALAGVREAQQVESRRALAVAQLDATATVLAARDRLLGRVRAALEERIARAGDDPAYREAVAAELEEALDRLPAGRVVVRAGDGLVPVLDAVLRGRNGVTLERAKAVGSGFTALAPDEGIEIDATLEARLEHAWPQLAVAVLSEIDA